MAIDITPFLTPYTPPGAGYSPTGPYGRHLVAVTEKFAGLADKRRAQELEDEKFRLQQARQAEVKRSALAREVHNRDILGESKRSAIAREKDAALTQTRLRRKQAATMFKAADAAFKSGDDEAAKILLGLAGFDTEQLTSPAETGAAVEALGEVVSTGEQQDVTDGGPGEPLTKAEKREKLGLVEPPPLPGMGPGGLPAGQVPRETLPAEGAPPAAAQGPAAGAPPLAGGQPLAPPGAAQPAYDPSQVPAGMAPPGVSREQYLLDERAREPAYAQVPAAPALPGQPAGGFGLPQQPHLSEQMGADIAAAESDPGMRVTTPFGESFEYNPVARREEVRSQIKEHFQRYIDGSDPMDMPAALQAREMADTALQLHGGDSEKAVKYLDKVLGRHEKETHADYRKEIGVEASKALAGAKRAAESGKGPGYERRFISATRLVISEAKSQGYYKDTESMQHLRQAERLLKSGQGYAQQQGVTMIRRALEKGVATDKDIERAKFGYMSFANRIDGWFSEATGGVLKPAHIEKILGSLVDIRIANLKHLQKVRNTLDAQGDSMPEGAIADAYRTWTDGAFKRFKVKREQTLEEGIANSQQNKARGTLQDPRLQRIPDREEVRAEADAIERAQGPDAKRQFLEDQDIEDIDSTISNLLREGVGGAAP